MKVFAILVRFFFGDFNGLFGGILATIFELLNLAERERRTFCSPGVESLLIAPESRKFGFRVFFIWDLNRFFF